MILQVFDTGEGLVLANPETGEKVDNLLLWLQDTMYAGHGSYAFRLVVPPDDTVEDIGGMVQIRKLPKKNDQFDFRISGRDMNTENPWGLLKMNRNTKFITRTLLIDTIYLTRKRWAVNAAGEWRQISQEQATQVINCDDQAFLVQMWNSLEVKDAQD